MNLYFMNKKIEGILRKFSAKIMNKSKKNNLNFLVSIFNIIEIKRIIKFIFIIFIKNKIEE